MNISVRDGVLLLPSVFLIIWIVAPKVSEWIRVRRREALLLDQHQTSQVMDYQHALNGFAGALEELRRANDNTHDVAEAFKKVSFVAAMDPTFVSQMDAYGQVMEQRLGTIVDHLLNLIKGQTAIEQRLVEFNGNQRRIMRDMLGAPGSDEDDLLEEVRALRDRYPELSPEDALKRVRNNRVYSQR